MLAGDRVLAWMQPLDGGFQAAFVSENTIRQRGPATRWCASPEEARRWIEAQAAALEVPVAWVSDQTDASPPAIQLART